MWYLAPNASGIIIIIAWGMLRPARTSSSRVLSKQAESLPPGTRIGNRSLMLANDGTGQLRLAGPHRVAVAAEGVDLAVVGDARGTAGPAASSGTCWCCTADARSPGPT